MQIDQLRWQAKGGWDTGTGGTDPSLVLYFGSTECIEAVGAPAVLSQRFPGAKLLGCSTAAGILGDEIDETGIVGLACRFDHTGLRLVEADVPDAAHAAQAGRQLGELLRGDGLAGAIVLSDGVNVDGSALASAMVGTLGGAVPVSGGLAGDGAKFTRTLVGAGEQAGSGRVAALGFYGNAVRIAHGSAGGWDPFGPRRHITKSRGCVLHELDGKPALALYERYLDEEAAGLPGTALLYPLLVWDPEAPDQSKVRTVLGIDRACGTMTFAGDIPQGWGAQLMRGNFDRLVDGAARAGQLAREGLAASSDADAIALLVSCVGRHALLGQRIGEELHAVAAALEPHMRRVGFYSHGEITPDPGSGHAMLQNQTMTVTLLAEAA